MSHVVMQAAEFPTPEHATRAAKELEALVAEVGRFEKKEQGKWDHKMAMPPLVKFGRRHGVKWPDNEASSISVKGVIEEDGNVLQVDRMVFFWIPGYDLGGDPMREVLRRLGATEVGSEGNCNIEIRADDPDTRLEELTEFLDEEDYQDQYSVRGDVPVTGMYFSLTVVGKDQKVVVEFDDSGVQDWDFTAVLPQLSGEDPIFRKVPT